MRYLIRTMAKRADGTVAHEVVLAAETGSRSSLAAAVAAALTAAGEGAEMLSASEVHPKPVDVALPAPGAGYSYGAGRSIFEVQFRGGSGADGTTPASVLVEAAYRTGPEGTISDSELAIELATGHASAAPATVAFVGTVDLEA